MLISRKLLALTIAALSVGLLGAMLVGGRAAQLLFGALAMLFPVALMALGALRDGRLGGSGPSLLALALLLEGGYWGMVSLAGRVTEAPWIAGLPAASALFLGSIWLLPLVLVSIAYAVTFDRHGIREEDMRKLRSFRD